MTKRDVKYVVGGAAVGGLFFFALWWLRRTKSIPVINPGIIKWEAP